MTPCQAVENPNLSIGFRCWKKTKWKRYQLSIPVPRPLLIAPLYTWVVTSSSTCTAPCIELEATLDVRGASDNVGKAPLADEIFRMVMRLLSETRSVLEYLSQHLPTVRNLDILISTYKRVSYSFPKKEMLVKAMIRLWDRRGRIKTYGQV